MAYNMNKDAYSCDFCDFEMGWGSTNNVHGNMWECEVCGHHFCSKCFVDRFGQKDFDQMVREEDRLHCPDCWQKIKKSEMK